MIKVSWMKYFFMRFVAIHHYKIDIDIKLIRNYVIDVELHNTWPTD